MCTKHVGHCHKLVTCFSHWPDFFGPVFQLNHPVEMAHTSNIHLPSVVKGFVSYMQCYCDWYGLQIMSCKHNFW